MSTCPSCRTELPEGARFCPACGTRLDAAGPEAAERKVVTTLFADLVGFTALGERHDPEDIDAALRGFYGLARTIVERFGGVVEKFIGDAVVGLFGVPAAHEDDAERAVRAALELVAHLHELPPIGGERLQVRCAVNTGPALVRLNARPEAGEGVLVGDAVNTCARLLAQAPAMGVVAGDMTRDLTERHVVYEHLPSVRAKGKTGRLGRWLARGPRSRRGLESASMSELAPLVGREVELAVLNGLLAQAIASHSFTSAFIVGEAGVGKSRLLREFFRGIDEQTGFLCNWRQSRCPPYGSDLAFWPLREIVSAHAGILSTDTAASIEHKLALTLGDYREREWMLSRLRPLVGVPGAVAEHRDNFEAWRLYLERMALERPTVLVVEDLHWASDTTLAFFQHLGLEPVRAPLLLVLTSRPDSPSVPVDGTSPGAGTLIDLRPLTRDESTRLARHLWPTEGAADSAAAIVDACGGNPLFAEELARFMADNRSTTARGQSLADESCPIPGGIAALIAARLDALEPDERTLLCDASVVGRVFWPQALLAAGSPPVQLPAALKRLVERDFLVVQPSSLFAGHTQYAFRHALTRQVAYGRLTRRRRADKHAGVARWMEESAPSAGLADLLAHHYETAYDLAAESGDSDLTSSLRLPASRALERAGDQTRPLDAVTAERQYGKAAALVSERPHESPGVLGKWAEVLWESGREREALVGLDAYMSALETAGEDSKHAVASATRALRSWELDSTEWPRLSAQAQDLLEHGEDSEDLVPLLEFWAFICFFHDDRVTGTDAATRAIDVAERLGLPASIRGFLLRGIDRCERGDDEGFDDIQFALEEARRRGDERMAATVALNLADQRAAVSGPAASLPLLRETLERADQRHDHSTVASVSSSLAFALWWSGQWDEADDLMRALDPLLESRGLEELAAVRSRQSLSCLLRGSVDEAERLAESSESLTRQSIRFETRSTSLVSLAIVRGSTGDITGACALLRECADLEGGGRRLPDFVLPLSLAFSVGVLAEDKDLADRLSAALGSRPIDQCARSTLAAVLGHKHGDPFAAHLYARSAHDWAMLGVPYQQAWALLGRADCLMELGRTAEAVADADRARVMFEALGAVPGASAAGRLLESLNGSGRELPS